MSSWFEIDKNGLAAILERRGKAWAIFELIQNAWDSGATEVKIWLNQSERHQREALLVVQDNGEGFDNLDDSFTMFGKSRRASDPTKRGRYSLGEKLVLSICKEASIATRTGMVVFSENNKRKKSETFDGTKFSCVIKMTHAEYEEVCERMKELIPPIVTFFNEQRIDGGTFVASFEASLPTVTWDVEGNPGKSIRKTEIGLFEMLADGQGMILEMGIPVVECEIPYRVNVLQKVPLNMDRDNVTPAFLKAVQVAVMNNMASKLQEEDIRQPWAQEALGDARATPEAVKVSLVKRFGERAVVATPGDPIANATASQAGFTVIPGGSLPPGMWANVRKHELLQSSGKVFPTPSPEKLAKAAEEAGACPSCGRRF